MKTTLKKVQGRARAYWFAPVTGLVILATLTAGGMLTANHICRQLASGRIFSSVATVPANEVGLVLGTSKVTRSGQPNLHFNHIASYDEPTDMRNALIAAGVPAEAITCDYAGFRTLDSVVRAKEIFNLPRCTIITEAYHCPRALWIARQHGLAAVALAAPDVGLKSWSLRAEVREQFARTWCAVDLYLLHRQPKFLGRQEPILVSLNTP